VVLYMLFTYTGLQILYFLALVLRHKGPYASADDPIAKRHPQDVRK
jgi:hypothetical protein